VIQSAISQLKSVISQLNCPPTTSSLQQIAICSTKFLLPNIKLVICILEERIKAIVEDASKVSYDNMAVPQAEVLNRLLRAEAAAERNLNRAIDRLERLQRRRKGEMVPPPVSVRLTR
jgi:hypothetical protein